MKGSYVVQGNKGGKTENRRIGVVWHTQGAGKSLTMAFYAGRLCCNPPWKIPTIVVITDRNDLDDGSSTPFALFKCCGKSRYRRQLRRPDRKTQGVHCGRDHFHNHSKVHVEPRGRPIIRAAVTSWQSRTKLTAANMISSRAMPVRCETHYQVPLLSVLPARPLKRRMPIPQPCSVITSASTISNKQWKTANREDLLRRPAGQTGIEGKKIPKIDSEFDEATEGEEIEKKEKLKTKWAALEAIVGTEKAGWASCTRYC